MSLGDQQDPVVTIWEEKGKSQGIDGVEDNKVVRDLHYWATRHISRDNVCTRIEVTRLSFSTWTKVIDL